MSSDLTTMIVGAAAWTVAIPAVKVAGNGVTTGGNGSKVLALLVGFVIAWSTTPLLSMLMGWKTPNQKVRGVALVSTKAAGICIRSGFISSHLLTPPYPLQALGTAQVIDGMAHLFYPAIYHENPNVGLGCAGNIFYGAGLLGILSAYQ